MAYPFFLTVDDILFIHQQEIQISSGEPNIREQEGLKACVDAPKASFGGEFLYDIFVMAASYVTCLTMRHPFVDGNKRTALASALSFLYLNGFTIEESYDEELADVVLKFLTKELSKEDIIEHFRSKSLRL
jgi:death-on-curing protein